MNEEGSLARRETVRADDPWGVEWVRVARRVLRAGPGIIGLCPVGGGLDMRQPARHLGRAIAGLSGKPVGLFEPWTDWGGTTADALALDGGMHVIALPAEPDAAAAVEALERAAPIARARFQVVLADLTGLVPEHRQAATIADAVVLFAAPGRVREDELLAVHRTLPPGRDLGVVLIG